MVKIITAIIVGMFAVGFLVLSILHFRKKGFLLNNSYIYASKQEREKMNKKPYYRQSAVVYALTTGIFLCLAVEIIAETGWLLNVVWVLVAAVIVYTIVSSIKSEIKK